jgi:hypothetical protein
MNTQVAREARDILNIVDDRDCYPSLPEYRKTVAVSLAAVSLCARHLEYVPETVISKEFEGREICRAALAAKDADCTILPYIPYPDVKKEGIQRFSGDTPAFILYSFADMQDAGMAQDAVKADAYCIQLVPDRLLTEELCKTALQSPNADEKMLKFISERFPELNPKQETERQKAGVKMKL